MIYTIMHFLQNFDNRQFAVFVWFIIAFIAALSSSKIRKLFYGVIKTFFAWKLTILYVGMFVYIFLIIFASMVVGFWKIDFLPIVLLWVLFVAFPLFFNFNKANEKDFFKVEVQNSLKATIFIEFIINFYVFPFWVEFIFVPILAVVSALIVVAETDGKNLLVKKFLNGVLAVFGTVLLIYFFVMLKVNFSEFATLGNLEKFYIPILMTVSFLPFVYLTALFSNYESFFLRLNWFIKDKSVLQYAKYKTILNFSLQLYALNGWAQHVISKYRFKGKDEVDKAIQEYKKKLKS